MKDFELMLSQLIDEYRNKYDREAVVAALNAQAELVEQDESWTQSEPADEPEKEA